MTNSFTLGKDGSFGNIDFNKLRSGITKKDLGIEANTVLSNIFDSIDNVSKKLILELPTEIPIHIIIKANKTLIIPLCLFFIMFWIYSLSHLF